MRCEGENPILQRVELAGAEDADVSRFTTGQAELLVPPEICVEMAENAGGLHFDGRHLGDGLHVKAVVGEFVTDFIVVGDDHDLDDDLWDERSIKMQNLNRFALTSGFFCAPRRLLSGSSSPTARKPSCSSLPKMYSDWAHRKGV